MESGHRLDQMMSKRMRRKMVFLAMQEQVYNPLQITEGQMEMYKKGREYLFNGGPRLARIYIRELQRAQLTHPDQVVIDVITGDARGTGKSGRLGQTVAAQITGKEFIHQSFEETDRLPMAHASAAVSNLSILGKAKLIDLSVHPRYSPVDLQLMEWFGAEFLLYAAEQLPIQRPDFLHLIGYESPIGNIGPWLARALRKMIVGMDFAPTNYDVQEDAATISDTYSKSEKEFQDTLAEKDIVTDQPIKRETLAGRTGTRGSMLLWRGIVSDKISELFGIDRQRLEIDLDYRNRWLRKYAIRQANNWGVIPELLLVRRRWDRINGPQNQNIGLVDKLSLGEDHNVCPLDISSLIERARLKKEQLLDEAA